jgi:hypothetical protein
MFKENAWIIWIDETFSNVHEWQSVVFQGCYGKKKHQILELAI